MIIQPINFCSSTGQFTNRVQFCYIKDYGVLGNARGMIRTDCLQHKDWIFNFNLYGGNKNTNDTIPLYCLFNTKEHATNLFLSRRSNISYVQTLNHSMVSYKIYIPGKAKTFVQVQSFKTRRHTKSFLYAIFILELSSL